MYFILSMKEPFRKYNLNDIPRPLCLIVSNFCFTNYLKSSFTKQFDVIVTIRNILNKDTDKTLEILLSEEIRKIIELYKINDISSVRLCTHDELLLLPIARLRQSMNISGDRLDDLEPYRNKLVCKKLLSKHGIRVPRNLEFIPSQSINIDDRSYDDLVSELKTNDLFIKPSSGMRSRNVRHITNASEFDSWKIDLSTDDMKIQYDVEEFINGNLYNCSAAMIDGEIIVIALMKNAYSCYEFFVQRHALGGIIIPETKEIFKKIKKFAEAVFNRMPKLSNCVVHMEVFCNQKDELIFLEVAARPPGAIITSLIEYVTGIQLEKLHFQLQLGLKPDLKPKQNGSAGWFWTPIPQGTIKEINTNPILRSDYELEETCSVDVKYNGPKEFGDTVTRISFFGNYKDVAADLEYLKLKYIPFEEKAPSLLVEITP